MASSNLSHEEIERLVEIEIKDAEEYSGIRSGKRETNWDRYYGRKLGNEVKGRSQFMTREVLDTIEWMMPYFIRTFASGDPKIEIEIKGQESWVGKAMMDRIQLDLGEGTPNLFLIFYQWFKDSLVSDTAFTKLAWDLDQENISVEFDELPAARLQQLATDPDVTIINAGEMDIGQGGISFKNISVKIKKTIKDSIYAENVPHWEFLASSKSRSVNDEHGKGHKTEVTVDYIKRINRARTEGKKPYFKNIDRLESGESKSEISEGEKTSYMGEDSPLQTDTEKGAKSAVTFIEWHTRLDVNDDGYLENVICFMGNGHLLRWEENKDEFIPFSALSPIIDCYKFFGISYADLLVEIQNLKTMLFRRILDNFDFQNSGRWLRDPNSMIDTYALLNNIPGSVITGKVDGLKDITPAPFNPGNLTILEYVDTIKENRTGITRYNQGTSADTLNKRIDINTPVPMADGTWSFLSEIQDRDMILGGDGTPTMVVKAHEIALSDNAYKVEFNGSGATKIDEIVADAEHLWGVYIGRHWKYKILNTKQIFKLLKSGERVSVPKPKHIASGQENDLPINPYVFGVWLGDGSKWDTVITTADEGVIRRVKERCEEEGWQVKKDAHPQGISYRITSCFEKKRTKDNRFFAQQDSLFHRLSSLGVFRRTGGDPHIPAVYFRSSYGQRLELLRGLMDSDGFFSQGICFFGNSNYRLIEDISKLIRSLSGVPNIRKVRTKGKKWVNGKNCNTKDFWLVGFNLNDCPFALERKAEVWRPTRKKAYRIVAVKKVEPRLMRCLTVDNPDGLWLIGEHYIATHNTARGIIQIQNAAMQRLELIGRIFAEIGLKDFYRKCVLLYQKYMRKPFTAKVLGQDKEIMPEMIQGRVITRVNMGVAASVGAEEAGKIEHMLGVLFKLNEYFPGLLTPEKIHNLSKRYITSLGFKNADDFIEDAQSYLEKAEQMQQQNAEMQKMMVELQQKFKEMELQIKGQSVQVQAQKAQADATISQAELKQESILAGQELKQDKEIAMAEIAQKERDSKRDHALGLLKMATEGQRPTGV